jgi:hypothetical protein
VVRELEIDDRLLVARQIRHRFKIRNWKMACCIREGLVLDNNVAKEWVDGDINTLVSDNRSSE